LVGRNSMLRESSWKEKKPYPRSWGKLIIFAVVLACSLVVFDLFTGVDASLQELFAVILASLSFSVALFPQYIEFSVVVGVLVREKSVKVKEPTGFRRLIPLGSTLSVLLFAPILLIIAAPPTLLVGCLVGVYAGFSCGQLAFSLYMKLWERSRGLHVLRYFLVAKDERGKRTVLERGLEVVEYRMK